MQSAHNEGDRTTFADNNKKIIRKDMYVYVVYNQNVTAKFLSAVSATQKKPQEKNRSN